MKFNRKLINKGEGKISVLQLIGFLLVLIGVCSFLISLTPLYYLTPESVAVLFFIIMLGVAFAFPSLLKDENKGLSTMRLTVFMITNVICMLLLKIGWASNVKSLANIGLDQWWMGVIAFIFGAKAVQSYFESKMAVPGTPKAGMAALDYSNADMAKLAVAQNESYLKVKFPNILSISDTVHDIDDDNSHIVAIYLKDDNSAGIPGTLEVKMPDGTVKSIATEIVECLGKGSIHIHQGERIKTDGDIFFGSVCCLVGSSDDAAFRGVVTAGHVYTDGDCINKGGILKAADQTQVDVSTSAVGRWYFQLITNGMDLGIAQLDRVEEDAAYLSFAKTGHDVITDKDVKRCKVTLLSGNSGIRQGYVLDYALGFPVPYDDGTSKYMSHIILVGSTNNRQTSVTVSQKGDSGGCVYNTDTKQLVGLILGGDDKFTYVLPLKNILENWNFKLI